VHVCDAQICSDPNCPAVWRGAPDTLLIALIESRTRVGRDGNRYWRTSLHDGWRRLSTAEDFQALNALIDKGRQLIAADKAEG
jgi:hypothetical protein